VAIPAGALEIAVGLSSGRPSADAGRTATELLIELVPALLLSTVGAVAATIAVIDQVSGRRPSLSRCLEPIGERFWPLVRTLVVIAVTTVGSLVVAVLVLPMFLALAVAVGTVYLFVLWFFAPQAAVIERRPVRGALARSRDLVAGAWLQAFAILVVVPLAAQLLLSLLARPATALSYDAEVVVLGSWNVIVMMIVEPFALAALGLLYVERRVARDGALEAAPTPAGPLS
jgi:hypothetical protein